MKFRHLVAILSFVTVAYWPGVTMATSDEYIPQFDSSVQISPGNVADITETIQYNFGSSSHHGIYRIIPINYSDGDNKYYLALNYLGTTDEAGQAIPSTISKNNGQATIKLGDANKTVTGQHIYKIHYQLSPVVNQQRGLDHVALDVTGLGWSVPIDAASATITLSNGASWTNATCYYGASGSTTTCPVATSGSTLSVHTTGALYAGQGITVEANLPHGYVNHYLTAGVKPPQSASEQRHRIASIILGGAASLVVFTVLLILLLRRLRQNKRRRSHTIIAEYEAPDGLTPGEIGYLHDNTANTVEVTATLIELAVRGYLKIVQVKPKSWLQKARYELQRLKSFDDVSGYERELLDAMFQDGTDRIAVSDLDATKMSLAVAAMRATLKRQLVKRGYYGVATTEKGIINKLLETGNLTVDGGTEWAKVEGLKLYLEVAEKDRLNFSDAPAKTPERFNKLLPYAVALGVEKAWAKQFDGIDITAGNSWYAGSPGMNFTAFALASDLGDNFSATINSNFVAPSGGGGSAGGGFGGGGGGSW